MTLLETLRGPKILDMSIFDWVLSIAAAVLVGKWFGIKGIEQWTGFFLFWILFGIVVHWSFGVKTMLGYYVGLNEKPERK